MPTNLERWPFVKPRAVRVGAGHGVHGSIGPVTACGKVWRDEALPVGGQPAPVTCGRCIPVLDSRNTYNCRNEYAVLVSYEQDAFAAGVPVADATAWRKLWAAGDYDALTR